MTDDQFKTMMAMLEIIAQNTAVIAAQGHLQRPLSGFEYGQCADSVRRTADQISAGLEIAVLPPGDPSSLAQ